MKQILKNSFVFILLLGVFAISVNIILRTNDLTIVKQQTTVIGTYTWRYYTIDMRQYLINLENSLNLRKYINILPTTPDTPTPPGSNMDVLGWLSFVAKCILTGLNYIIYAINFTLAPVKLITYPIMIFYSLLGLDTTSLDAVQTIETINTMFIPYIPITF